MVSSVALKRSVTSLVAAILLAASHVSIGANFENSEELSPAMGFVIFMVNSGMMLEFGDEIFCATWSYLEKRDHEALLKSEIFESCRETARTKIAYVEGNHPIVGLVGAIFGYVLFAPLAIFYYLRFGRPKTAREIFESTFKIELMEGGVCVLGQVLTDGNLLVASMSLALGFLSGLIRGGGLAFMHQWRQHVNFRHQVAFWSVSIIFASIYFFGITNEAHAGGMGGVLKNTFKQAASPPVTKLPSPALKYNPPGSSNFGMQIPSSSMTHPYNGNWHIPNVTPEYRPSIDNLRNNFNLHSKKY